ncbi:MAG: ATP-dependent Clp protease proteolytic subunit [Rubrobacteraceae bacterium]
MIAEETGQPFEKVERDTDRDFIMSPEEAIKYGVIDGIVSNSAVAKASENGKG